MGASALAFSVGELEVVPRLRAALRRYARDERLSMIRSSESHPALPSKSLSAASIVGKRNRYPSSSALRGTTRWLASTASAASPSASRTASSGAGRRLGRPSTLPIARASSRFLTGSGAHAASGPVDARVLEREPHEADLVGEVDPRLPEVALPERAAREEPERADQLRERAARGREDDPGAQQDHAGSRGGGARRPPPTHGRRRRGSPPPAASARRGARRRASRSTRPRCPRRARAARRRGPRRRSRSVARTRLSWMRRFFSAVQRPSAMGSPARFTQASQPASAASHAPGHGRIPDDEPGALRAARGPPPRCATAR